MVRALAGDSTITRFLGIAMGRECSTGSRSLREADLGRWERRSDGPDAPEQLLLGIEAFVRVVADRLTVLIERQRSGAQRRHLHGLGGLDRTLPDLDHPDHVERDQEPRLAAVDERGLAAIDEAQV